MAALPDMPIFLPPSSAGEAASTLKQELLAALAPQLEEAAAGPAALQAPSLRDARFAGCDFPALQLEPTRIEMPPAPPEPALPPYLVAATTRPPPVDEPHRRLPRLEPPVLLPSAIGSGASSCGDGGLPELLAAPLPEPQPGAGWLPGAGVEWGVSLAQLVAQDMVLDDGCFLLPAVILDEEDAFSADSVGSSGGLLQLLQAECDVRPASSAHAALHLDWSLSSTGGAALRPHHLMEATAALDQRLLPQRVPTPEPAPNSTAAMLDRLMACYQPCQPSSSARQGAKVDVGPPQQVKIRGGGLRAANAGRPAQQKQQGISTGAQDPLFICHLSTDIQGANACTQHPTSCALTALGACTAEPAPMHITAKPPSLKDDLHYFLRLQQAAGVAQPAPAAVTTGVQAETSSSNSASDSLGGFLTSAARSVTRVALPGGHLQLLHYLWQDEQRLLQSTAGISQTVAASDFLSLDALQEALQDAAGQRLQKGICSFAMCGIFQTQSLMVSRVPSHCSQPLRSSACQECAASKCRASPCMCWACSVQDARPSPRSCCAPTLPWPSSARPRSPWCTTASAAPTCTSPRALWSFQVGSHVRLLMSCFHVCQELAQAWAPLSPSRISDSYLTVCLTCTLPLDAAGLLAGVTAARELRETYQQVESGKLEDHPKQKALWRILGGIETLSPVDSCLSGRVTRCCSA